MNAGTRAYIGFGANMPFNGVSGSELLAQALAALQAAGFTPLAVSSVWQTAAWPPSDQPDYYNAVVAIDTGGLSPQALWQALREIELSFGRERRERWAARTLDLDIVAMDGAIGRFGDITLPHPRMQGRAFVLAPLAEIAPDWRHPASGLTAAELLKSVPAEQRHRRLARLGGR
ncbi:MAG: 2-amino-4-hydroxy-6-hydroxymethyldihydropteridine diphosphokinase [Proteobacteria bacterium]|nr:2-amino-4-hydroxy-6-hydroxymethyldihydropteridine diphosphokinase [Pseudomonadota bacterium]